jgi:radical SAM superfamily enzyme YgiQ (UPF0313 family)
MSVNPREKTVLLLQPGIGFMDSWRSAPALPLGLLHAASLCAQNHTVRIFDQRLHADWESALRREILDHPPMLVATTMFLGPAVSNALAMLEATRSFTNAPTAAGGVLPSIIPETAASDPRIDFVIQGEGEQALDQLAAQLAGNLNPDSVPGLWRISDNATISSEPADLLDLDSLPEIPYHLIPVERYMPRYRNDNTFYMETSRGCPRRCTYCFNPAFNRGVWRKQSAERVCERLQFINRTLGVNSVYFVDDNFFIDRKRALTIAETLGGLKFIWQVQGADIPTLNAMPRDELAFLKSTGLARLTIGIESGSPRMRKILGKNYSNDDVRSVLLKLREFGFIVYCSFMCNLPGETDYDLTQSVSMVFDLMRLNPQFRTSPFYAYAPAPGTELFLKACEQGFHAPETLEQWGRISFDRNPYRRMGGRPARFYEGLYISSLFSDNKQAEYAGSAISKFLSVLYRPVARLRLRSLFFRLMPEIDLFRFLSRERRRPHTGRRSGSRHIEEAAPIP